MRRMADCAFMLQDYDLANQTYHSARKDFSNDKAWKYFAGTQEMIGICHYMAGTKQVRGAVLRRQLYWVGNLTLLRMLLVFSRR